MGYTCDDITDIPLMINSQLKWSTAYFFINKDTGFYSGVNSIYRTVDGGETWLKMNAPGPGEDSVF